MERRSRNTLIIIIIITILVGNPQFLREMCPTRFHLVLVMYSGMSTGSLPNDAVTDCVF